MKIIITTIIFNFTLQIKSTVFFIAIILFLNFNNINNNEYNNIYNTNNNIKLVGPNFL
jgi:hypothetical protein